jgi:Glycosyl transferases group 1
MKQREAARPRRVVVLGRRGSHRTEAAITRGLRTLGHRVRLIDVPRWYRRLGARAGRVVRWRVDGFAPDTVILTRYAADLDGASLDAVVRGRRSALWFFDLVTQAHERIVRLGRVVDQMFVTCPSQADLYRIAGVDWVGFLPQAVDPEFDRPALWTRRRYRCEVSFVGSGNYPYRHRLLRDIAANFDLQIRGPGWEKAPGDLPVVGGLVRGRQFARVVRGAAISIGGHAFPNQRSEQACASNRMWKILGCGGFYLGPWVEGIDQLARGGEHCVWYDPADEAVDLVRYYLRKPDSRAAIARAGLRHALEHHTYAHRLALLLEGQEYALDLTEPPGSPSSAELDERESDQTRV